MLFSTVCWWRQRHELCLTSDLIVIVPNMEEPVNFIMKIKKKQIQINMIYMVYIYVNVSQASNVVL